MKKNISIDTSILNISVTCVVIRFLDNKLEVLLQQDEQQEQVLSNSWVLPRNLLKMGETTLDSVNRSFQGNFSFEIGYLDQFRVFQKIDSNLNKMDLTIGYCALVRKKEDALNDIFIESCNWHKLQELPNLVTDHHEIFSSCLEYLSALIKYEPVAFNLLPIKFTLLELMNLYEQILKVDIDKSNFRRKMLSMNLLVELNEKQKDVSHRAAKFYEFDYKRYRKKVNERFSIGF
jgi:8-oxo-dGTP diphosphatase